MSGPFGTSAALPLLVERVPEDKARTLNDGLGVRRLATDPLDGTLVEVLEITPALAAREGFEAALRTRAGWLSNASIERLAAVRRIERDAGSAVEPERVGSRAEPR